MLDARLGYRNKGDAETDWKEYAKSFEARNLNCDIDEDKKIEGYHYNCSILPLFDLGSLHHDYYLLNIRCAPTVYRRFARSVLISNLPYSTTMWQMHGWYRR